MAVSLADLSQEDRESLLEEALLDQKEKAREARASKEVDVFMLQVGTKKEFRAVLCAKQSFWRPETAENGGIDEGAFTLNILNPDQLVSPVLTMKSPVTQLVRKAVNKAILRIVPVDHTETYLEGKRLDKGSIKQTFDTPDTTEAGKILALDDAKALLAIDKVGNINTLNYMLESERQGKNLVKRTRTNIVSAIHDRVRAINNKLPGVAKIGAIIEEEPDAVEETTKN